MSCGSDEVETCVHTEVNLVNTAGLLLLQHVRLMLIVQKFDDGHPGITVIDIVPKARSINDRQTNYIIGQSILKAYTNNAYL